jgi:hypothetical protein
MVSMAVLLLRFLQDTVITMVGESHLALQEADRVRSLRIEQKVLEGMGIAPTVSVEVSLVN